MFFTRVDPETKEQAEAILSQLGIPMSNAIGMFPKQIVMHRGIPFDMKRLHSVGDTFTGEFGNPLYPAIQRNRGTVGGCGSCV